MSESKKTRLSVTLDKLYIDDLDFLVEKGYFMERQDAIRDALRHQSAYYGLESHSDRRTRVEEGGDAS